MLNFVQTLLWNQLKLVWNQITKKLQLSSKTQLFSFYILLSTFYKSLPTPNRIKLFFHQNCNKLLLLCNPISCKMEARGSFGLSVKSLYFHQSQALNMEDLGMKNAVTQPYHDNAYSAWDLNLTWKSSFKSYRINSSGFFSN